MPKKSLSFCLCLLLTLLGGQWHTAQAQSWRWAVGLNVGRFTIYGASGNVYTAGNFSGTATFGNTTLTNAGLSDGFVAKAASDGTWQWAVGLGSAGSEYINALAVDANGNVYVTGSFQGILDFGATTLASAGTADAFVAKLTPAGTWQWAERVGGGTINDITVDGNGNVSLAGSFSRPTISFGSITLTNSSTSTLPVNSDSFVAQISASGLWQWATQVGGTSPDQANSIVADAGGDLYVSGSFKTAATFGSTALTSAGPYSAYVAKLTSAGGWQWAVAAGRHTTTNNPVVFSGAGNIYVASQFSGTDTLGTTTLTSNGGLDAFVGKLSPTGTWQWVVQTGSTADDYGGFGAVDGAGNVYVNGIFSGPQLSLGTTTLTNAGPNGTYDSYVACLSPGGVWQWITALGSTGDDELGWMSRDANGSLYMSGSSTSPSLSFGTTTLLRTGSRGSFLARLDPRGVGLPEEAGAESIQLSPNPAHGTVRLTNLPPTATTVEVIDALGRTVRTALLAAGTSPLAISGLPPGLYVVRAGGQSRRLVVE